MTEKNENEPQPPKNIWEQLPGPVRLIIVDTVIAASIIAAGIPPEWAVTAVTVGDIAIILTRPKEK